MDEHALRPYASFWGEDQRRYLLVRYELGHDFCHLDIYRRNGVYCTPEDPELAAEVATRMRATGVEVRDGIDWEQERRLKPFSHLWMSPPGTHILVRYSADRHAAGETILHRDGSYPSIGDTDLRQAIVERMLAAGVACVELPGRFSCEGDDDRQGREANQWVARERHAADPGAAMRFCLVVKPAFAPHRSWRLLEHHRREGGSRFFVRYRTWFRETPLSFPEWVRLPPAEQGWGFRRRQVDVRLDRDYGEAVLKQLSAITLPPYVDGLTAPQGFDGTRFRLILGAGSASAELRWWQEGPEAWRELVRLMARFCRDVDHRREVQVAGC